MYLILRLLNRSFVYLFFNRVVFGLSLNRPENQQSKLCIMNDKLLNMKVITAQGYDIKVRIGYVALRQGNENGKI